MNNFDEKEVFGLIHWRLVYELVHNGNSNWISFEDSAFAFRVDVRALKAFLEKNNIEAKEPFDDADRVFCLFDEMLEGSVHELPCVDDGSYAALGRILKGLGVPIRIVGGGQ